MNKNRRFLPVLSVLLAILLSLSPLVQPIGFALAEQPEDTVSEAESDSDIPSDSYAQPEEAEESTIVDVEESQGGEEAPTVPDDQSDVTVMSSNVLSFLYLDVAEVEPGETQNVVVALNEEIGSAITSATLTIQNDAGEDVASYDLSTSDAMAALFSFDTSELSVGTYQVGSMSVVTDAGSYVIDFSDAQVRSFSVSYGVSSLSLEGEEGHDSVTAYTIDEDGNLVEAESVAMAVSSAQQVTSSRSRSRSSSLVIALDPGHGGYDSGAIGVNGVREADLTWKIAGYCRDELVNQYGATVVMTRGQNENPSLKERAQRAADAGAGVLVSIHLNSTGSGAAYGSEIYVPNSHGYDLETHSVGVDLAEKILDQLSALGLHDRGVKTRDYETGNIYDANSDGSTSKDYYGIIRESRALGIPGIIVEHAFIDNASDYNNYLSSDAKLKALGVADATGIAQQFELSAASEDDYAAVYDFDYYVSRYPDVAAAYGNDRDAVFSHFLTFGMAEGRRGNKGFDVEGYYNRYADLRRAFGTDLPSYYEHYARFGVKEGRDASPCDSLSGWVTVSGGLDYSPVYDGAYYFSSNPDLRAAYTKTSASGEVRLVDDAGLLSHFLTFGMAEGRRGNKGFNVKYYQYRYDDLQGAYGTNLKEYYLHYLQFGRREGRETDGTVPPNWSLSASSKKIMGTSATNAAQIARYYRSAVGESSYPASVYKSKGAPSIDDFARIVCEEAAAEGVRAEVVFCQAMHETGWLRFGGDVSVGQCNFAGIGATGGGVAGATFADVRTGIRAQVQHLKAYASTEALNNACVDPRFNYVTRGIAPTLDDLDGRWATGKGYGAKIYSLMQELLKS
ncbi:MAG TPA: N-acetylmuramoyl-L-alanine amidase [Candidatus Olsenella excrementavium]|uniref:N-acetylmuramoyl-L-alanine amidase n=1 Tax=Candidatus Olsenella excrementavium TaxID=2838709 RepID=A0A9D1Z930_9ACTN|nr:N-acetylmuramoyl-L-alanine amidase [Candidatus Olsenella excrementavium]